MNAVLSGTLCNLRWPNDLKEIGMTYPEKKRIHFFLKLAIPQIIAHHVRYNNAVKNVPLKIQNKDVVLPLSLSFIYNANGSCKDIMLLLNKDKVGVVGKGGQRAVKLSYSLKHGIKVAKKELLPNELSAMQYLLAHHSPGLPRIFGIRECIDRKSSKVKLQYFEELYQTSLGSLIGSEKLNHSFVKLFYIYDLIQGFYSLQTHLVSQKVDSKEVSHPFFHRDFKPDNILVNGKRASFTDFGLANILDAYVGTVPYMSPAMVAHALSAKEKKDTIDFTIRHGSALDSWSLGICIAIILINRFSQIPSFKNCQVPPLKFIESRLSPTEKIQNKKFANLTQEEVDHEIEELKFKALNHADDKILFPLWGLVGKMLQVSPEKMAPAKEILQIVEDIFYKSHPLARFKVNVKKVHDATKLSLQSLQNFLKKDSIQKSCTQQKPEKFVFSLKNFRIKTTESGIKMQLDLNTLSEKLQEIKG